MAGAAVSSPASRRLSVSRGRYEVDAVAHPGVRRRGGEDEHLVADHGARDPCGRGTLHVVRDHVDVDLALLVAHQPRRVGAERRSLVLGHLAPLGVPVVARRHRVEADRVGGEDDLDALVEARVAVVGEVVRAEGESAEARV